MVFRKSWFFKALFACICLVGWADVACASNCVNYSDTDRTCGGLLSPACAGSFCHHGIAYECRSGCYCTGGRSTSTGQNVQNKCAAHQDPSLEEFGVSLCPDSYPYSEDGASRERNCYNTTSCPPTTYLPDGQISCTSCPAGSYCTGFSGPTHYGDGSRGIYSCTGNKYSAAGVSSCSTCGIGHYVNNEHTYCYVCEAGYYCDGTGTRARCTGNQYSSTMASECSICSAGHYVNYWHTTCNDCLAGYACTGNGERTTCTGNQYTSTTLATECSVCDGVGRAVIKTGGLNTGCDVCQAGTYAANNHVECLTCEIGYMCTAGEKRRCEGNEYSKYPGATVCSVCSGVGYGVIQSNGLNIDCGTCPNGTYANQGVCYECPVGHSCSGGIDNGLCPAGTCASVDGSNCSTSGGGTSCVPCTNGLTSNETRTECVSCNQDDKYYEDGVCKPCPQVEFNATFYERVQLSDSEYGFTGKAMCGIKLKTGQGASLCKPNSNVKWHIVNDSWTLVAGSVAVVDTSLYLKDPLPNSPNGTDVDWCAECPRETFNISLGAGANSCEACSAGYCIGDDRCLPCKPGYYCPGDNNGAAQECQWNDDEYGALCDLDSIGNRCGTICPKGSFSAAGKDRCTSCASGYTTAGAGTPFDPSVDTLQTICTKIQLKLKYDANHIIVLPELLRKSTINTAVISSENN